MCVFVYVWNWVIQWRTLSRSRSLWFGCLGLRLLGHARKERAHIFTCCEAYIVYYIYEMREATLLHIWKYMAGVKQLELCSISW